MPFISADSIIRCIALITLICQSLKGRLFHSLKIFTVLWSLCSSLSLYWSRPRPVFPTCVILMSLCYEGPAPSLEIVQPKEASSSLPTLEGPKHDLKRLLKKYRYTHDDTTDRIQIITDFDFDFTDVKDVEKRVRGIAPTMSNIEQAITSVVKKLAPQESLVLWLGLHSNFNKKVGAQSSSIGGLDLTDGSAISREQLSRWLRKDVNHEAEIIVVADTCDSENILDLPLKSYRKGEILYGETKTNDEEPGNLLVIGATMSGQSAESFKDTKTNTVHGLLTWFLLDAFDDGQKHSIPALLDILNRRIPHDQFGQTPVITSTRSASSCIRLFPE